MKTISILVQIPDSLYQETQKLPLKSKKGKAHLFKLIAVTLYELYSEEASPTEYYKILSTNYIQNYITTHDFYVKYFSPFLRGDLLLDDLSVFAEKIFQTDGDYSYPSEKYPNNDSNPKHYRINPKYLLGPSSPHQVEIEVGSLNDLFPEIIEHFDFSCAKLTFKTGRNIIETDINRRADLVSIKAISEISGFFLRNFDDWDNLSHKSTRLPKKINLLEDKKKYHDLDTIKEMVLKRRVEESYSNVMLIHSRDKRNKDRFQIVDYEAFLEEQKNDLKIRLNIILNNAEKGSWMPNISEANGRLNHLLSYSNKFAVDYFCIDGEPIASIDCKFRLN